MRLLLSPSTGSICDIRVVTVTGTEVVFQEHGASLAKFKLVGTIDPPAGPARVYSA